MIRLGFVLLFTVSILAALSCGDSGKPANLAANAKVNVDPPNTPLPAATIDELASGRKVYMDNCAKCHREDGSGGEVEIEGKKLDPEDLTSAKIKRFPDDKMIRIIMNGAEDDGMPGFKGKLPEGEMRDVVKFVRVELQKMPAPQTPKS